MGIWTFNRGEWTEAYVFLRLLGVGRIYGADRNFHKDNRVYLDVREILRYEEDKILRFKRTLEDGIGNVQILDNDTVFKVVTSPELDYQATRLYKELKEKKGNSGSFSSESTQKVLESLGLSSPKPKLPKIGIKKYGNKTDIIITYVTSVDPEVMTSGFSIKSHMGSSSTLFNSSTGSNLIYEVEGCNDDLMYRINSIHSETDIFSQIRENRSLNLKYCGGRNKNFVVNMSLCESKMMEILSCLLLIQIGYLCDCKSNSSKDIVDCLVELNPVNHPVPELFYETVIKRFLFNSFSGMTASKLWDGHKSLTGGYIDVNRDGEILYYRAMSDDVFENYLFEHTFWDRPSRGVMKDLSYSRGQMYINGEDPMSIDESSILYKDGVLKSKKGDWGYIYKEGERFYISINFQVRFR